MNNKKIIKSVYVLFFIFLMTIFLYATLCCVKTIYNPSYITEYILGIIFSGCIISFFVVVAKCNNDLDKKTEVAYFLFMIIFSFVLRWISIMIMKTVQISDFATCNNVIESFNSLPQDASELIFYREYYAKYPAWFPYMRLVENFYDLFCNKTIDAEAVKYANAIINSLTCGGIYYAARCYFSKKSAIIAGMLYCCFPSLIIWTNIMTPDHITMALFTLQAIIWYWMWRKKNNTLMCILLVCVHSSICALLNWFKPLSILFLLVFVFFMIGTYNSDEKKQKIAICIIYCTSFVFFSICGSKLLTTWTEEYIQLDVVDSTWQYIYVGTAVNEDGSWNMDGANVELFEVLNNYDSIEEEQKILKEMALKEISKNKNKLPKLYLNKFKDAISYEGATWYWANTNSHDNYCDKLNDVFGLIYHFISNGYYLLLLICVVICSIFQMTNKYKNENIFLLSLIVVGFLCIQVLSVPQARYKIIVMPYFVMISAYGLDNMEQVLSMLVNKLGKMVEK